MPVLGRRSLVCAALVIALAHPPGRDGRVLGQAVDLSPARIAAVERFVSRYSGRLGLPGVAVAVATPDSVVLAFGQGEGTIDGGPITGHTPFFIGSLTKTLTAAAVARLAGEGVLDLDAPVEDPLPTFGMRDPFIPRSITLRHLLQHRSGLSQWSGHDATAQREGTFRHLPPAGPPGADAEYSSLNFIILGRVLESASGRDYGALVEETLLQPLGMRNTFVESASAARPANLVRGHQSWFGIQVSRSEPVPPAYLIPAGFAAASAHDLGRYGGMLVGGGTFAGERIFDEETVAALLGPLDGSGRALGWGRSRVDGRLVLEHDGNARTSAARMRLVPGEGYALVVLANTNSGPFLDAAGALLDGIDTIVHGEPAPSPWPSERLVKGAILLGTVLSVAGMTRRTRRWWKAGTPTGLDRSWRTVGGLALDLGLAAGVLVGVPRLVGVPLSTMVEYFPDLGVALVVSAGAGAVGGVFAALTRSARRRITP